MPGPLHYPRVIALFPFRYRDAQTGKWVRARYRAELHVIRERYAVWETIGPAEFREGGVTRHFNPWRPVISALEDVDVAPKLQGDERSLVLLFLRRYLTWCARQRRFAQMEGASRLFRKVSRIPS